METSGFFNAEKLSNGNYDRVYLAANFASYFASFIGNGVFGGKMSALQVMLNEPFSVTVQSGQGYINGYWYQSDVPVSFSLVASNPQPRIDSIVLRLDFVTRSIHLAMLTGMPSASPVAPTLTRNENTWELCLANINIPAEASSITAQDIIDTRLDKNLCGLVHGVVDQLDTTEYGNRLNGFIENFISGIDAEYKSLFLDPINTLIVDANMFYSNTFLPSINATDNLAKAAYNDFVEWIESKKTNSTQEIQNLIDQLNQIVDADDVGVLFSRVIALESDTLKYDDIVDSLDSEDATKVLSANQGRALEEKKIDKVVPLEAGNLARLDADGNVFDSGSPATVPSGEAGGDLTGTFPSPMLRKLDPQVEPSTDTLDYGGTFTTDKVTVDTKGRVTGVDRKTLTLPSEPFRYFNFLTQDLPELTTGEWMNPSGTVARYKEGMVTIPKAGYYKITLIGGGGGGRGSSTANVACPGGGAGAMGIWCGFLEAKEYNFYIGDGGVGRAGAAYIAGHDGGCSLFRFQGEDYILAGGGSSNAGAAALAANAVASPGGTCSPSRGSFFDGQWITMPGAPSEPGNAAAATNRGGRGGSTMLGQGGGGGVGGNLVGQNATGYGAGGGGANANNIGGNGAAGCIIIESM
ncbi:MAG: hypothetical protein LBI05_00190 [Planctomycetaceae bacterium]|jgi:hypothetical protein|nr:hypothetical protein [Planctomycetaceae bacterium]